MIYPTTVTYRPGEYDGYVGGRTFPGGGLIAIYNSMAMNLAHELVHACQWATRGGPWSEEDYNKRDDEAEAVATAWCSRPNWLARLNELLAELTATGSITVPLEKLVVAYQDTRT